MSFDLNTLSLYAQGNIYDLDVPARYQNGRIYFKLTNSCNLSCEYCFQRNDVKSDCKPVDINKYEMALHKCFQNKNMDFYLFGGEPFLENQYNNVFFLFSNSNASFFAFTNGCYSARYRELIRQFRDRLTIIVTLDGPKEVHNKRRRKGEAGSFDIIVSNMDYLESIHANWICQINIDDNNYSEIDELFSFLDSRYSINNINTILNPVLHCATSRMDLKLLEKYVALDSVYHLEKCVVNCKTARKLTLLLSGQGVDIRRCDIENTYVVDFEKKVVYCCPQNSNSIVGTVETTGLCIDQSACLQMFARNQKKYEPCNKCEFNQICGRGCFLDENNFDICKHEVNETIQYFFNHVECFLHMSS